MSTPTEPTPGSRGAPPTGVARDAVTDLAERLGVDPAEVAVIRVEEVVWRDGSLGCPEPGMRYTQALVDGSRVVLSAGGVTFEYHAGGTRKAFLCENPSQ